MVILAGVVAAVALIAILGAALQLGYHPGQQPNTDLAPPEETRRVVADVLETEEATVREAAWEDREGAVDALETALDDRLRTLERRPVGSIRLVRFAPDAALSKLSELCPRTAGKRFGPCVAIDGIVVQNRDDTTHLVAVVLEVTVIADETETVLTLVVRPTPRVVER
jgi:hypothetical protein